jgi:hypothetical protein
MKMRICIPLKLSQALAILSLFPMAVTDAYSQVNADTAWVKNKGSQVFSQSYCQGEFEKRRSNYNPFNDLVLMNIHALIIPDLTYMRLVMPLPIGSRLTYVKVKAVHITQSKATIHPQTEIAAVTRGSPLPAGRVNEFFSLFCAAVVSCPVRCCPSPRHGRL